MPWEPVQKVLDGFEVHSKGECSQAFYDGNRLVLFEWVDYYVKSSRGFEIPGLDVEKLGDGYLFKFSNYVGISEVRFNDGGSLPVLILSKKIGKMFKILECVPLDKVGELVGAFEHVANTLTENLLEISSSLPFSLEAPTGFSTVESDEPINELFAYHFLRSNRERTVEAFEAVLRRMKRKLVVEEELLGSDEVDEITPEVLLSTVQHPEYLAPAGEGVLIADYLKGYAPTKVLGHRKYESFDTPENRFAKYFLNLLIEWSERVIETFSGMANLEPIKELLGELEFIGSDGLWDDVGEMTLFPYTSQTLLKGDGYRDLLELYREFTAYVPFFEELRKAMDNKDIAKLYEYWAFFRLVEELGKIFGKKRLRIRVLPAGKLSERGDVYAEFDNGWRLYYNKRLTPGRWSYSVALRPDFSLFNGDPSEKGTELIGVFDAKFKLDVVNEQEEIEEFDEETETAEKTGNYETWAKLEDVYKMHTYRDASGCRFAVVVYPGERSVFFDTNRGKVEEFDLEDVLTGELNGVGYLRFVPEVKT
ncbi:DUF2357 domain-containing protein [Thermococcus waiotapuensis]|uniref:DUF2357 domain-containing protein n=1 Tax=Thermococcus waiotapuensis TaxID=90909 RepID=A0AAE4T1C2_9EURY|nr:DUF2357 domain-containing protein [Thermococcus waiotapuensis]MDV3104075.1 DUF2357 domain-containing protein [Thermococcus waiotapuensis]